MFLRDQIDGIAAIGRFEVVTAALRLLHVGEIPARAHVLVVQEAPPGYADSQAGCLVAADLV